MLNKKEITAILVVTLILGFAIRLVESIQILFYSFLAIFIILIINVAAKKMASYYLDSEIQMKIWEVKRYGFKKSHHFKKPIPAGAILPIIFSILSLGYITWLAPLEFEVKAKVSRAAKRHGLYTFSEMTELHIGLIAAAGILANLALAVIGYFIGFPPTFARLNIYFALFNMIPISNLDGNKIFFGSLVIWSFLASLVLIATGYAVLLI
jgi:Zn-dependent protease